MIALFAEAVMGGEAVKIQHGELPVYLPMRIANEFQFILSKDEKHRLANGEEAAVGHILDQIPHPSHELEKHLRTLPYEHPEGRLFRRLEALREYAIRFAAAVSKKSLPPPADIKPYETLSRADSLAWIDNPIHKADEILIYHPANPRDPDRASSFERARRGITDGDLIVAKWKDTGVERVIWKGRRRFAQLSSVNERDNQEQFEFDDGIGIRVDLLTHHFQIEWVQYSNGNKRLMFQDRDTQQGTHLPFDNETPIGQFSFDNKDPYKDMKLRHLVVKVKQSERRGLRVLMTNNSESPIDLEWTDPDSSDQSDNPSKGYDYPRILAFLVGAVLTSSFLTAAPLSMQAIRPNAIALAASFSAASTVVWVAWHLVVWVTSAISGLTTFLDPPADPESTPQGPRELIKVAYDILLSGNYSEVSLGRAVRCCHEAISRAREVQEWSFIIATGYLNAANAYLEMGRYDDSIKELQLGMKANRHLSVSAETRIKYWQTLGDLEARRGNKEAAIAAYQESIRFGSLILKGKKPNPEEKIPDREYQFLRDPAFHQAQEFVDRIDAYIQKSHFCIKSLIDPRSAVEFANNLTNARDFQLAASERVTPGVDLENLLRQNESYLKRARPDEMPSVEHNALLVLSRAHEVPEEQLQFEIVALQHQAMSLFVRQRFSDAKSVLDDAFQRSSGQELPVQMRLELRWSMARVLAQLDAETEAKALLEESKDVGRRLIAGREPNGKAWAFPDNQRDAIRSKDARLNTYVVQHQAKASNLLSQLDAVLQERETREAAQRRQQRQQDHLNLSREALDSGDLKLAKRHLSRAEGANGHLELQKAIEDHEKTLLIQKQRLEDERAAQEAAARQEADMAEAAAAKEAARLEAARQDEARRERELVAAARAARQAEQMALEEQALLNSQDALAKGDLGSAMRHLLKAGKGPGAQAQAIAIRQAEITAQLKPQTQTPRTESLKDLFSRLKEALPMLNDNAIDRIMPLFISAERSKAIIPQIAKAAAPFRHIQEASEDASETIIDMMYHTTAVPDNAVGEEIAAVLRGDFDIVQNTDLRQTIQREERSSESEKGELLLPLSIIMAPLYTLASFYGLGHHADTISTVLDFLRPIPHSLWICGSPIAFIWLGAAGAMATHNPKNSSITLRQAA